MIDSIIHWLANGGWVWLLIGAGLLSVLCAGAAWSSQTTRKLAEGRLTEALEELKTERAQVRTLESRLAGAEAEARAGARAHGAEVERLNRLHGELKQGFEALSAKTFEASQKSFFETADALFKRQQEAMTGSGTAHEAKLAKLLAPMNEQLQRYEAGLKAYDTERQRSFVELKTQLTQMAEQSGRVASETSKLSHALRGNPKVRGRWGEETLRNILEMAGMSQYTDFETEVSVESAEGRQRPDVVLRLPGDRRLVIDAKVSLSGYLDAMEAETEAEREAALQAHAKQLREHINQLASKAYWEQFENAPDFVVMFVPGENYLAAAAERLPSLFQDAFRRNVVLTTPSTLIALAKAVAYGWQQEKQAENAREIAALGADLYKRMQTMGRHVGELGQSLDKAVERYNKFTGSLERMVLPQARRFVDLQIATDGKDLAAVEPVDRETNDLVGKDLLVDPQLETVESAQVAQLTNRQT